MAGQLTVLVTGASSGIGKATAVEFARRGHQVFAAARTASALADLSADWANITGVALDVTDPDSVRRAWEKIQAETGGEGVDVLVNNAGVMAAGVLETMGDDDVHRQFATNVFGMLSVTRAVLPGMRERRSGSIVNVSSVLGRFSLPGVGVYAATKYAVEALSDSLRQELIGLGVNVVVVEPSFVATNFGAATDPHAGSGVAPVPEDYAQLAVRGEKYLADQISKAQPAARVAAVIADAAEHRRPKSRYVVPASTKLLITLMTSMSDRLADRAKRRTLGLS